MSHLVLHKFLSVVLIAIILCASMVDLCHDAHVTEKSLCKSSCQQNGISSVASPDGQCPSGSDADHAGSDNCAATCYCSCHLPVIATGIKLVYAPVITVILTQQTFSSPQDIFLSLFVPPDNLA